MSKMVENLPTVSNTLNSFVNVNDIFATTVPDFVAQFHNRSAKRIMNIELSYYNIIQL